MIAFLADFSPQEQNGAHSCVQDQLSETYQYRSKQGDSG